MEARGDRLKHKDLRGNLQQGQETDLRAEPGPSLPTLTTSYSQGLF